MNTKVCIHCKRALPATREYFDASKYTDGLKTYCKDCRRARIQRNDATNREKKSVYNRKYAAEHRGKLLAYYKDYCEKHKEHKSEYRKSKREYFSEYQRLYRRGNEKMRQKVREWEIKNKEKRNLQARAHGAKRKAQKKNNGGTHTYKDILAQYKRQKGKCYYCGVKVGKKYHIEHIIPLSRGGPNGPSNLVIACPTCNDRKGAKLPHEWAEGGRLL